MGHLRASSVLRHETQSGGQTSGLDAVSLISCLSQSVLGAHSVKIRLEQAETREASETGSGAPGGIISIKCPQRPQCSWNTAQTTRIFG